MVKDGIVLGHKISRKGIELDRAKIDVVAKFPPLISIKVFEVSLDMSNFTIDL